MRLILSPAAIASASRKSFFCPMRAHISPASVAHRDRVLAACGSDDGRQRRLPCQSGTVACWQSAFRSGRVTTSAAARSRRADRARRRGTNSCRYRCPSWQRSQLILLDMAVLRLTLAPSQHHSPVGQEHGRTIPLAEAVPSAELNVGIATSSVKLEQAYVGVVQSCNTGSH